MPEPNKLMLRVRTSTRHRSDLSFQPRGGLKTMKRLALVIVLLISLVMVACGTPPEATQGESSSTTDQASNTTAESIGPETAQAESTPAERDEVEPITILAFGGDNGIRLQETLKAFEVETGIPVQYEPYGDNEPTVLIKTRVAGGSPPDVAVLSRPGEIAALARQDVIFPLAGDGFIEEATLRDNYSEAVTGLGTFDGKLYALPLTFDHKSTVWYNTAAFEEAGVTPPKTWEELIAVTDRLAESGLAPWSIGGIRGWPLTDWFENIYLRTAGPEMYNKLFVTHEVAWTDPSVVEAMEYFRQIVDPPAKMAGGIEGTLSTEHSQAFDRVVKSPPEAAMSMIGGFMYGFGVQNFPDLTCGEEYDWFPFPDIKAEWSNSVVSGASFLMAFDDRPEVRALMEFMAGETANTIFASAEAGSAIVANKNVSLDVYPPCLARQTEALAQAETIVFDGADLAPPAVGGEAMFIGLQDFVEDPGEIESVLNYIEEIATESYE